MLIHTQPQRGFSLIELMIGVAVLSILILAGLPSMTAWIQNTQIKSAAEAMQSGLQLARAEALRRNSSVRFQLVDSLTSGCSLSITGASWVVSLEDAAGKCDIAPSEGTSPKTLQKKDVSEGARNASATATGGDTVTFNGLGRMQGGTGLSQIDISNPTGGTCQTEGGAMRCLRIRVTTGGDMRMCDPAVTDSADPRFC
jgi:type IV fimbrial biogenesis protein FimT